MDALKSRCMCVMLKTSLGAAQYMVHKNTARGDRDSRQLRQSSSLFEPIAKSLIPIIFFFQIVVHS